MPRGISLGSKVGFLYNKGLSDQEIADNAGAHKKSIARWRRLRNLPSNVKQGRPTKKKGTIRC